MGGGSAPADREVALGRVALENVMTREVEVAHPLDTIDHAARRISDLKIGCLPVVADGGLVGIITSSDMMRTLTDLIGARDRGSWVEVEVEHRPGSLAAVTDVIRERHVNIASVFLTPAHRTDYRTIVLRLETTDPQGVMKGLQDDGYTARSVKSTAPVEVTHEEK
jgi:acetoin utilization protein AcuB